MKKAGAIILIIIVAGGILGCALLLRWKPVFELHRQHIEGLTLPDQPILTGLTPLVAAVKSYSRDHISRGQPLPASLNLGDLIRGGYIGTNDIPRFDGGDVTFYPNVGILDAKAVLVQVRMPDGRQIVVLADGSIQQSPR